MGDLYIGVRSSHPDVHTAVTRALSKHVVGEVDAPSNYSLQMAGHENPDGATSDFHFLYRGFDPIVRTRDPRRLLEGFFGHLASHATDERRDYLRLDAVAFVREGQCLLAPADLRKALTVIERRLNKEGVRVLDRPWATVDHATRELVVSTDGLEIERSALDPLINSHSAGKRRDPGVPCGRYPVIGWAFGRGRDGAGPLSRSMAVAEATKLVMNVPVLGGATVLKALTSVLADIDAVALWSEKPEGLAAPIAALAR